MQYRHRLQAYLQWAGSGFWYYWQVLLQQPDYETLEDMQVVNEVVGGQSLAVFWADGTASALDTGSIASGRDVGSAAAYSRVLDKLELNF